MEPQDNATKSARARIVKIKGEQVVVGWVIFKITQ